MKKKFLAASFLVPSLVFLSGCEWDSQKPIIEKEEAPGTSTTKGDVVPAQTGEVLLTIKGKPAITVQQFENYLEMVFKAEPQYRQLMAMMPDAEYEMFNGLVREAVAESWVKDKKLDQSIEYQTDLKLGTELLNRQLAMKYFQEEYPKKFGVVVTDAEAQKDYDNRKDKELVISRGGFDAQGVSFANQDDAKSFLEKVQQPGANFEQLAKDQKLTTKEFKNVSQQSFDVDGPIREKIIAIKKFPTYDLIKVKDAFWVIKTTGKEETKYVPFEQVKEPIKQQLKIQKLFTQELDKVKKELGAVENKAYFERKKAARQQEMEKAQAQMKGQETTSQSSQKEPKKENLKPQPKDDRTVKGA
jgi:cytidylate kinase